MTNLPDGDSPTRCTPVRRVSGKYPRLYSPTRNFSKSDPVPWDFLAVARFVFRSYLMQRLSYKEISMPFPKQEKQAFTVTRISAVRQKQPGIYAIFNHSYCIYIGKADCIQTSLLEHIRGQSQQAVCIFENDPQYWLAMVVAKSQLNFWEGILTREFKPVCMS